MLVLGHSGNAPWLTGTFTHWQAGKMSLRVTGTASGLGGLKLATRAVTSSTVTVTDGGAVPLAVIRRQCHWQWQPTMAATPVTLHWKQ
jgi:hypothetical protein